MLCKRIGFFWKFSILGRNSGVLKVLAHGKSDEIQIKLKSLIFMAWWRDVLIKHSQDDCGVKKWVFLENLNFCRNSWVLKVLAHGNSDKIQKQLKSLIFTASRKDVLIKLSPDERCAKVWVFLEIFNFLSKKFLRFKGVS